jgi:hypothetical protein
MRRGEEGMAFFQEREFRISIILLIDQNISDVENETDGGSGAETDDEKQQQQLKKLEKKKGEATKAQMDLNLVMDGQPRNLSKEVRLTTIYVTLSTSTQIWE